MSTTTNQYLIIGIRLPYDNDTYEEYEGYHYDEHDKKPDIDVLYDGRDGRYIFIGKVLAKSDDDMGLEGPIELQEPDFVMKQTIAGNSNALFNTTVKGNDVRLWLVTHYR